MPTPTALSASRETLDAIRAELVQQADDAHSQYPQYANHWDRWVVVKANRDIIQRGFKVASRGDFLLMNPASFETCDFGPNKGKRMCTVYVHANHVDTVRFVNEFTVLS